MSGALSRVPLIPTLAALRWPIVARYSSMKLATFRWNFSPSCSACGSQREFFGG